MFKIDFDKLKQVEKGLLNSPVASNTLQTMLNIVVTFGDAPFGLAPNNVALSMQTLKEMGILVMEPMSDSKKEPELLKS